MNIFKIVVLPLSGVELEIRRVHVKDIGLEAAISYLQQTALYQESAYRIDQGNKDASAYSKLPRRPETPQRYEQPSPLQIKRALVELTERRVIEAALENTRLPFTELLNVFKATVEMPQFGMGSDYDFLVTAIIEHSGFRQAVSAFPPEEAARFLGTVGATP